MFDGLLAIVIVIALLPMPLAAQETTIHIVQPGETLFRIGLQYNLSTDALVAANGLTNRNQIFSGQQLIIPSGNPDETAIANPLVASAPTTIHTIQPGETLGSIARRYGLTIDQLARSNNIDNPNEIYFGQQLNIWSSVENNTVAPNDSVASAATYVVQRGDTLGEIARNHGVSVATILAANTIDDPNRVLVGQVLTIPGSTGSSAPTTNVAAPTIMQGKQIVVDLSDSRIYAYENGQLLRNVLVSTGLPQTPTVVGDFNIYFRYESQTMYGDDFYLPDVPYVMYFFEGYAIHGTYWHNNFGTPMSHGCVNLPTPEAEWFFRWAELGTPVHVQV